MRLLRLLTAAAVIGGAAVFLKRLIEERGEEPRAAPQRESPGPAPKVPPQTRDEDAGGSRGRPTAASSSNGGEPTKAELYERAQELGIEGRSKMSKRELQRAIEAAAR